MNQRVVDEIKLAISIQQRALGHEPSAVTLPRLSIALVGNPNCGKSALFNLFIGTRQK